MGGPDRRDLLEAAGAVALLLVGTAVPIATLGVVGALVASNDAAGTSWWTYYRVVVLKGMLPQLLVALPLHPLLRRYRRRHAGPAQAAEAARPGTWARLVETFVLASLAYCAVAPTLLVVAWPGWPALRMSGPAEQIGSYLGMTCLVTLAIRLAPWATSAVLRRREETDADA